MLFADKSTPKTDGASRPHIPFCPAYIVLIRMRSDLRCTGFDVNVLQFKSDAFKGG